MRILLAGLLAVSAPMSSLAAGIERLPVVESRAPEASVAAPAVIAVPSALMSAASISAAPALVAAPAAAAEPSAAPAAAAPAAQPATAAGHLESLGAALAAPERSGDAGAPAAALDAAFDDRTTAAAADGPEPTLASKAAGAPAALKPATSSGRTPRWRTAVPNLLTFGNMSSGLASALLASDGRFTAAALAILAGNVFDALDGRATRALGVDNKLGIDLDSLADMVTFGAAPALLIAKAALLPAFGVWGFPIAASFAAGALYRLARFNVGAHAEKAAATGAAASSSFTGLPSPGGAGMIVALTLALPSLPAAGAVAAAVTALAAGAMVSRLPYPTFKKGGAKALLAPAAAAAAVVAPLAALGLTSFIPAAVFGLYLAAGPLAALSKR
jgi:CDP-diacylglycerol--serine O-phosphatidyltransferase